ELKGGFAQKSVFLEKSNMGMGAHVREGCLLEEEAGGAHCVGLKQTILFPFVTLGSLINFCDCFMSGGTSRQNHSEVGSSYIHFNFTPDADKTTPSLIGDVPRGVMLREPPIFLGGQGGIVGPLRIGYGNVVAAGSILRKDYPQNNQLIRDIPQSRDNRDFVAAAYRGFGRIVENNLRYLANLKALEAWYTGIRKPFFEAQEFGTFMYSGAMNQLSLARKERLNRLSIMSEKAVPFSRRRQKPESPDEKQSLYEHMSHIEDILSEPVQDHMIETARDAFLRDLARSTANAPNRSYIDTIQNLPPGLSAKGSNWLQGIVDYYCQKAASVLSSPRLFRTR
ncbi:MAG TPA: UDP-N-acetylglucosamine pyrophosphorylase, partial [Smithellaceae bacterium]|nr:UDP-N-acetylglucosamine pyrophosphorylase [Smithellaceae bacterium]